MNILIADDEKEIIRFLRLYLEKDNYTVYEAYDGKQALDMIHKYDISLALLDIMMPKMDGFHLIQKIRESYNFPVIMLTAKDESEDMVLGLGLGADDYITKPFNPIEVCARVEANLRRYYALGTDHVKAEDTIAKITCKDLELDIRECCLRKMKSIDSPTNSGEDLKEITLTSMEYKILKLFMENPGRVFTKQQIYEEVWNDNSVTDDNNIMSYISKIREKLGDGNYITTIRGLGYRFNK